LFLFEDPRYSPTEQIYFFTLNVCYKVGFKFKPSVSLKTTWFSFREINFIIHFSDKVVENFERIVSFFEFPFRDEFSA